jgi:hypothetical protein
VSAAALGRLESLGLDEGSLARIAVLIADGDVPIPETHSSLVAAIRDVIVRTPPSDAAQLATLVERSYRHHTLLAPALGPRWSAHLDGLAATHLDPLPPPLVEILDRASEASWLVIDAFGLPLLGPVRNELDALFPAWQLAHVACGRVGARTTTDAFLSPSARRRCATPAREDRRRR